MSDPPFCNVGGYRLVVIVDFAGAVAVVTFTITIGTTIARRLIVVRARHGNVSRKITNDRVARAMTFRAFTTATTNGALCQGTHLL